MRSGLAGAQVSKLQVLVIQDNSRIQAQQTTAASSCQAGSALPPPGGHVCFVQCSPPAPPAPPPPPRTVLPAADSFVQPGTPPRRSGHAAWCAYEVQAFCFKFLPMKSGYDCLDSDCFHASLSASSRSFQLGILEKTSCPVLRKRSNMHLGL